MKKIFEIPIYAFSNKKFDKKVQKAFDTELKKRENSNITYNEKKRIIWMSLYPASNYDYNHIVGVIRISYDRNDVYFTEYYPANIDRYRWKSKRKVFLVYRESVGFHFRHRELDNETIIKRLESFISTLNDKNVKKGRCLDLECFIGLYKLIDYKKLFTNV